MAQLTRHQIGATLLSALRQEGMGVRDLFEGRQEPVSWFFRCLAYDQSELDIMESGVIEILHAPSALIEISLDEVALACANVGPEGLAAYLAPAGSDDREEAPDAEGEPEASPPAFDPPLAFHPEAMLGFLSVDVAPPALWLQERESGPEANERLAKRLADLAQGIGKDADSVEVHIEGALDSQDGWADASAKVRPAGVSVHFTFDLPLAGSSERTLRHRFGAGAATAASALERLREVFQAD
ncbi:MAG: hypothetical protein ACE5HF_05765 [Gemmatimonadota bacterium]